MANILTCCVSWTLWRVLWSCDQTTLSVVVDAVVVGVVHVVVVIVTHGFAGDAKSIGGSADDIFAIWNVIILG